VRNSRPAEAPRAGRRSGGGDTRETVLAAAKRQFSALGYDRTTLRSVAAEAGVNQKLVGYFFRSKQALFVAATELPFDPAPVMRAVLDGDPQGRGERLARFIVDVLENPEAGTRLIAMVRAAASEPDAADLPRDLLTKRIWGPAAALLGDRHSEGAVNLVAVQLLGLVMARYVIRAQPLASLPPDAIVTLLAPLLQQQLSEKSHGTS